MRQVHMDKIIRRDVTVRPTETARALASRLDNRVLGISLWYALRSGLTKLELAEALRNIAQEVEASDYSDMLAAAYTFANKYGQDAPAVYTMYNRDDNVLYIGQTKQIVTRILTHLKTTPWIDTVDHIFIHEPHRGKTLIETEHDLIKEMHPLHNKVGNNRG